MKLHHIAIWTFRLEELKDFYVRYFGGKSNEKYVNPQKGFESYFLSFEGGKALEEGASMEIMSRRNIRNVPIEENRLGLAHFAFSFPSKEEIIGFTERLRSEGYRIVGEPRVTGDGYFESAVLDPDGNRIECVYKENEKNPVCRTERIETERLLLRPFEETDAEAVFVCCRNPELGRNAGWKPHETLEESRSVLHSVFIGQENVWAIVLKESGRLIGSVGVIPDPRRENPRARMLGYWLAESDWGKGYMTEAVQTVLKYSFKDPATGLVTAYCYPHNTRSQRILERNGFLCEGKLFQAEQTYDGRLLDHYCYCLRKTSDVTER